jgi:hypothetical protein
MRIDKTPQNVRLLNAGQMTRAVYDLEPGLKPNPPRECAAKDGEEVRAIEQGDRRPGGLNRPSTPQDREG